jgi:hypothetical protein
MSMGVPPGNLSDADLTRELTHLKEKHDEIFDSGTADQRMHHTRRTGELEEEFLRRRPSP